MTDKQLRLLLIEDSDQDVELILREVQRAGYEPLAARVDDVGAMRAALETKPWDVVLCDSSVPRLGALTALGVLRELKPKLPLIVVSGTARAESLKAALDAGAKDYVLKDDLDGLVRVIERALRPAAVDSADAPATDWGLAEQGEVRGRAARAPTPEFRGTVCSILDHAAQLLDAVQPGDPVRDELERIADAARRVATLTMPALGEVSDAEPVIKPAAMPPPPESRPAVGSVSQGGRWAQAAAALNRSFEQALRNLWMEYQPIVSWKRKALFGYEARVRSTERAFPRPSLLFDAAERLGRVQEIGRAIRAKIAEDIERAPAASTFFVNIDGLDLEDPDLFSSTSPLSASAERIVLGMTERCSLRLIADADARVQALRSLGYRTAIGTVYDVLLRLVQPGPDMIKLSTFFARGIDRSTRKRSVVRNIVQLASRDLELVVLCEGVETIEERSTLVALGADLLQGHLFGAPERGFSRPVW